MTTIRTPDDEVTTPGWFLPPFTEGWWYQGATYPGHSDFAVDFNRRTVSGGWLQDDGDPVLAAADGTVAEVNAARMLLMPAAMLLLGVNRTLIPGFAQMWAEGQAARIRPFALRATLALLAAILVFSLLLLAAWEPIAQHLLQGRYDGIGPLVVLWALVVALQAVTEIGSAQLQAASRFRVLALRIATVAGPVVVALVPMILWLGSPGSLLALAAGQAVLAMLLWREAARRTPPGGASCAT